MSRRRSKIVGITFQRFAFPCCPVACERNRPTSDDLFYVCCVGLQFPPPRQHSKVHPSEGTNAAASFGVAYNREVNNSR